MTTYISHNPFTETTRAAYPVLSSYALINQLDLTHAAQQQWSGWSFSKRAEAVLKLAQLIHDNAPQLAELAVAEMGKTYKEALAEVNKCTTACHYYAEHSERILAPSNHFSDTGKHVTISYEPMGIVLGIFPWNFPYWQVIRSAIPVLMSGNGMLVKPAPNVPECALKLQELFNEAGFPKHIISTVFISEAQVAGLIIDNRIKACTLTGSDKAGAAVATQAASQIKKTVLELGGSDPFIVLEDADLNEALNTAITARFQNNGQSCIASKRFILHRNIASVFLNRLAEKINTLVLGDPSKAETHIGPIARADLRDKLSKQVNDSIAAGARIFYRHPNTPDTGYFYAPTILTHIPVHCPAYFEELFGPVISAFEVEDDEQAIRLANDSLYGLGASVWSTNRNRALAIAQKLECGQVFINGLVKSHTAFPFGGVKYSGIGRELGEWGLKEFCQVKTIWQP